MILPLNVFELKFSGHHVVEAAAGTGKTYSITSLYVRALVEKRLLPSQILVLTFTNDATSELKLRLRKRILDIVHYSENEDNADDFVVQYSSTLTEQQKNHLSKCLTYFDEAAIYTIHGFCQRILSEHHLEFNVSSNFNLKTDIYPIIEDASDLFWEHFFFQSKPKTRFQKWVLNKLNVQFQNPDKLIELIKPLVLNSSIEIEQNLHSFDDYKHYFKDAHILYSEIKAIYLNERIDFLEFFYSNALNKKIYKHKEELLSKFEEWLNQKELQLLDYKNLYLFGEDMLNKYLNKSYEIPSFKLFSIVQKYLSNLDILSEIDFVFKSQAVYAIRKNLVDLKNSRGILDYQDLLILIKEGIQRSKTLSEKLARRFPIAFIDEFQDTDNIQYSIFKSIYSNYDKSCLVMIGDPKQAIYQFRGADIHSYLSAKNYVTDTNVYSLSHNYRSSKSLIKGINSIFNGAENAFLFNDVTFTPAFFPDQRTDITVLSKTSNVSPLTFIRFNEQKKPISEVRTELAHSVAFESIKLLHSDIEINQKPILPKDITVLVDTHNNGQLVQDILYQYGLKSVIHGNESVFNTIESDQLFIILYAFAHPHSQGYIKSALISNFFGHDATFLLELAENEELRNKYHSLFLEMNKQWAKKGLKAIFRFLEYDFDIFKHIASTPNYERSITNYKHLRELLLKAESKEVFSIFGLIRYFRNKRDTVSKNPSEDEVLRLESDQDLIQIVTHHASKGLEYNIVFCPFLWNFRIKTPKTPILSDGITQTGFLNSKSNEFGNALTKNIIDEKAEKIRIAYVALTRAKAMCFVYINEIITKKQNTVFSAIGHLTSNNEELNILIQHNEVVETKEIEIDHLLNYTSDNDELKKITHQVFNRENLDEFDRFYSFSSLTQYHTQGGIVEDLVYDFDIDYIEKKNEDIDIFNKFSLPKGKTTGILLHNIFEKINFSDPSTFEPVIKQQMEILAFESVWESTIKHIINNTVNHQLIHNLSLSKIHNIDRIVEMEFNFPINKLDANKLFNVLGLENKQPSSNYKGFMKGFIDLIFRWKGKYYILDYKSNHLGNSESSYLMDELSREMNHSNYILQYHIYLIAFLRFIRTKNPLFDYENEFGGIIYLFLRGIHPIKPTSGVYFDKPKVALLNYLDELMRGFK